MTIPTLDPPLATDDVATFNSKAFDFVSDLVTWTTEVNSAGTTIATNASTASAAASTATTQAAVATSAATAAGAVAWVSGTTYAEGDVRYDTTDFLTYRRKTAGAGTTRPGLDSTNWALLVVGHNIVRRAITGADTVVVTDKAGLLDITSGTFTLAFTAAATLGSGFWVVVRNSGTGVVTLDPNSSETIDGATTSLLSANEARLIQCNGTAFYSIVLSSPSPSVVSTNTVSSAVASVAFSSLPDTTNAAYEIVVESASHDDVGNNRTLNFNGTAITGVDGSTPSFSGIVRVYFKSNGDAQVVSDAFNTFTGRTVKTFALSAPTTLTFTFSAGNIDAGTFTLIRLY